MAKYWIFSFCIGKFLPARLVAKGSIFLGNENLEPLVKGQTLVDILAELIDALANQQYLTPSGPTKVGPENVPTLAKIKSKLNTILSKLNQTS